MGQQLYYPIAFYILYTWCLIIFNLKVRLKAAKNKETSKDFFKTYQGEASEKVIVTGRHIDNQFQLPLLFFITCLAHIQTGQANITTIIFSWLFVMSRLLHSYQHLGRNQPLQRAKAYALGWLFIILMWGQLIWKLL